jgi:two-component system response regulator FlrC
MLPAEIKIVVVDDEPALLESVRSYLSRMGYSVTAFLDAKLAWEYFTSDPSACSVIIVDLTLGGMSGEEFIYKVMEHRPGMPVLATSGYPPALRMLPALPGARLGTLEKPFTPQMLIEALERLLANQKAAPG